MPNHGKRTGRKSTRRKAKEASYWSTGHNLKNKERRIKKHLKKQPNDKVSQKALETISY